MRSVGIGDYGATAKMRIVLGAADVKEGELRAYEVGKLNVCVARVKGRLKALDDWCNHAGCLLSGGRIEGNMVVCPCHEVGFDLDTGKNLTSPGVCDDQPAFELVEEDGKMVLANVVTPP
jgi:3-phenylpropionate/trans-cinnamate dioxygenase ferredoxin component